MSNQITLSADTYYIFKPMPDNDVGCGLKLALRYIATGEQPNEFDNPITQAVFEFLSHSVEKSKDNRSIESPVARNSTFTPPSLDEVVNYFAIAIGGLIAYNLDAQDEAKKFIDINDSYNWAQARRGTSWTALADRFIAQSIKYKQEHQQDDDDNNPALRAKWD